MNEWYSKRAVSLTHERSVGMMMKIGKNDSSLSKMNVIHFIQDGGPLASQKECFVMILAVLPISILEKAFSKCIFLGIELSLMLLL